MQIRLFINEFDVTAQLEQVFGQGKGGGLVDGFSWRYVRGDVSTWTKNSGNSNVALIAQFHLLLDIFKTYRSLRV